MNKDFLYTMLDSMSVSGYEIALQKKIINHMANHCDEVITDYAGNVICAINPDAPFKVLLTGHIDEIGLVITNIHSDGFLKVEKVGGIMPSVFPGHQVVVYGYKQVVYGSVVHCRTSDKSDFKVGDLVIDIGAKNAEDARRYVREGDAIHIHSYHCEMINGFLSARALDDRSGAFIILEALKRAKDKGCKIGAYAATTVGEETTMNGAYWAAEKVKPNVGIAVDVTYAQDYPGANPDSTGNVCLGKGPVICYGTIVSKKINELLCSCAENKAIPYQMETCVGRTGTDIDKMHFTAGGIVTALVSLPLRYMHTPAEVCSLDDIENSIELLSEFLCSIDEYTNIDPFC